MALVKCTDVQCVRLINVAYYCVLMLAITAMASAENNNQLLGIKYISYDNFDGTLASGVCCDDPEKQSGSCTPNRCDPTFEPCGTADINDHCDIFKDQKTAATYNNDSFVVGNYLGNGDNKTVSFLVLKFPFVNSDINFTMTVYDAPEQGKTRPYQLISSYRFVVDWLDPVYKKPPIFRRQILTDTRTQLVLDIVSQCSKHFYTSDCSVYCEPVEHHYECLDNGTIHCLPGWMGPKCDVMIDYCPGHVCQHGSTCVPVFLNYTCNCPPGFSGRYCQIITSDPSEGSTSTQTQPIDSSNSPKQPADSTSISPKQPVDFTTISPKQATDSTTPPTPSNHVSTSKNTISTSHPAGQVTPTSIATESANKSKSKDSSVAATASGVVVGLLVLVAAIVGVAFYVIKRKARSKVTPEEKPALDEEDQHGQITPRPQEAPQCHRMELKEEISQKYQAPMEAPEGPEDRSKTP